MGNASDLPMQLWKANLDLQLRLGRLLQDSGREWMELGTRAAGEGAAELDAEFRKLLRGGDWQGLAALPVDDAIPLARAFTHFLNLANVAEQHHRIRRRRVYQRDTSARPQRGSSGETFPRLLAGGVTPDGLRDAVDLLEAPAEDGLRQLLEVPEIDVGGDADRHDRLAARIGRQFGHRPEDLGPRQDVQAGLASWDLVALSHRVERCVPTPTARSPAARRPAIHIHTTARATASPKRLIVIL